jgi:HlyD family secretion protein
MTASGDIVTETKNEVLSVPIQCVAVRTPEQLRRKIASKGAAIADDSLDQEYTPDEDGFVEVVFVIDSGKAQARQVKTGIQSETHIEIVDGLPEGSEIVTGSYRAISKDLQNGSPVVVGSNEKNE